MSQVTEDFARQMLKYTRARKHAPLTIWEEQQLACAFLRLQKVVRAVGDAAQAAGIFVPTPEHHLTSDGALLLLADLRRYAVHSTESGSNLKP